MTARPTVDQPVIVSRFWKTRWRNESVRVSLSLYEEHYLIDVRIFRTATNGIDFATSKGLSLGVRKLPELARALAKAEAEARALGLIPGAGDD